VLAVAFQLGKRMPAIAQADEPSALCYRPKTVARMLETSEATLAWWRCRGGGPAYFKRGRSVFYAADAVRQFMQELRGPFRVTAEDVVTIEANARHATQAAA
jgi:hypothetical protein